MINAGIFPNDILVVDKSLKAENGKVVIAAIDGELTVKRYRENGGEITLNAENEKYENITFEKNSEAYIWGVVTNVIHKL